MVRYGPVYTSDPTHVTPWWLTQEMTDFEADHLYPNEYAMRRYFGPRFRCQVRFGLALGLGLDTLGYDSNARCHASACALEDP